MEDKLGKSLSAGKVASNVQKKLTRAQEKVMQKLGKADETKDLAFEEGVINFHKQLAEGSKLQRDLRAYLAAVKAMHECSNNVHECLADMYEDNWKGKKKVERIVQDSDLLWTDFHQKLVDHALISMDTYLGQFPDIRSRIAKRDRKLVDFDSARHAYASTHKGEKKKREGAGAGGIAGTGIKITKPLSLLERASPTWAQGILSAHNVAQSNLSRNQTEDELERAQKVFDEINEDLQEELPSLWNSRVGFYVNTFQSVAGLEEKFHREMGKLNQNLHDRLVVLEEQDPTRKTGRGARTAPPSARSGPDGANHTLGVGGPPPIPKSPSKLRPAVPPPPKVTPSVEMKTENILNLFDEANTPNISITSPTEFDARGNGNLLDMDLDSLPTISPGVPAANAAAKDQNWDTWEQDEAQEQPPAAAAAAAAAATVDPTNPDWGDDPTKPNWGDDPTKPNWGDDPTKPNWGDDGDEQPAVAAAPPAVYDPTQPDWGAEDEEEVEVEDATKPKWDEEEPAADKLPSDEDIAAAADADADADADAAAAADADAVTAVSPTDADVVATGDEEVAAGDSGEVAAAEEEKAGTPPDATATDDATAEPVQEDGEQQAAATESAEPAAASEAPAAEAAQPVAAAETSDAVEMPPGFIFKVQTMHDYNANDSDELELKAGDVVLVITFDNPDEQDDGWLMGVKESEWQKTKELTTKGVFPENFTQRL